MSLIRSEVENVQCAAKKCAVLAQKIMDTYLEISTKVVAYDNSISVLKKNLIALSSTPQVAQKLDSSERSSAILNIKILDRESARLKANLSSACSRLMGELGRHLDNVRVGLNSLILKYDISVIPEEQLFTLISISREIDDICRTLGSIQFTGVKGMEKIFFTLDKIKLLGHQ